MEDNCFNCSKVITSFVSYSGGAFFVILIMILCELFVFFGVFTSRHNSAACSHAVKQVFFIQTLTMNNVSVTGLHVKINPGVLFFLHVSHTVWIYLTQTHQISFLNLYSCREGLCSSFTFMLLLCFHLGAAQCDHSPLLHATK